MLSLLDFVKAVVEGFDGHALLGKFFLLYLQVEEKIDVLSCLDHCWVVVCLTLNTHLLL